MSKFDKIFSKIYKMSENQQSVPCKIKSCTLVYDSHFRYVEEMCGICRKKIGEPCRICQNNHETECKPVLGVCGHFFHQHCLYDYWRAINERSNLNRENERVERHTCPACNSYSNEVEFQEQTGSFDDIINT